MARFLIQRFIIMVLMLAALSVIVFVTIELPPGDFADRRALDLRSQGVLVTQQDVTTTAGAVPQPPGGGDRGGSAA